ncbi:DUF7672 family protein [Winogradskyella forsetii]|uniref:DUF7672 family protein n=1 Tax=Winogradskyella forsetii TaxID=2686077 RepID=UPI0015BCE2CE|nr:hypothetical protein [Winogradskyella forsetii]
MIRLYIIGLAILIIAILANAIIAKIGLKSWYGFIELLSKEGSSAFSKLNIFDYLWLFIAYPFILGIGYWLGEKISNLILN